MIRNKEMYEAEKRLMEEIASEKKLSLKKLMNAAALASLSWNA